MLKWLRKYNTYILVVGGCLLMVAFLLQGTLQELGRRGMLGGTVFRVGDRKVGAEEYQTAAKEHAALSRLIPAQVLGAIGGGANTEHWILLTQEAAKAGYVGGMGDGSEFIPVFAKDLAQSLLLSDQQGQMMARFMPQQFDAMVTQQSNQFQQNWTAFAEAPPAEYVMNKEQVLRAFAKLRGVLRMQQAYRQLPRYSDRRLATGAASLDTSADVSYVLVPAERATAGVPEPTDAEIVASFEQYKGTPQGTGDYGVGYKLPARVKLAFLTIDRAALDAAVTPDSDPQMAVEARKRFLAAYPTGNPPEGKNADDEMKRLTAEVKREKVDRVMRAAEQAVRAEFEKAVRKLDAEGLYRRVTGDWAGVDLQQVREAVATNVQRAEKVTIPAPRVTVRDTGWLSQADVKGLPGIGKSELVRGSQRLPFDVVVFGATLRNGQPVGGVRELAGDNDLGIQARVPAMEATRDAQGNAYFFVVLDARKESSPDSLDEVRADVARNVKRLKAFERLKTQVDALRSTAVASGLDAVAAVPQGATGEAAVALPVRTATVSRLNVRGQDTAQLDHPAFRDDVMNRAEALDATVDPAKWPADQTTGAVAVPQSLGVAVYQVKKLSPLTIERYRQSQNGLLAQLRQEELQPTGEGPFSLEAMEKRLGVKYEDGRKTSAEKQADKKPDPKSDQKS